MLLSQTLVYCFIREIYSRNVFCVQSIGQTEGCYMLLSLPLVYLGVDL